MNTRHDFKEPIIGERVLEFFEQYKSLIFFGLSLFAVSLLMLGCAAPSKSSPGNRHGYNQSQVAKADAADRDIEKRLRQEYKRWQGTRHHLGGTGSRGIDCSGFVQTVYRDVFNVDLPRTTKAQVRQGRRIPFTDLQAGDLVFFQPPSYPRHVGIYLGGAEFVHASKNKGVTLSNIDSTYWGKYYWTARRILPPSVHP